MNGQEGQIRVGLDRGWAFDPEPVKEFVAMATAEGFRPSSIDQGRGVPVRYDQFLHEKFGVGLNTAGWKEFAAYKGHLAQTGIARTTVRGYLVISSPTTESERSQPKILNSLSCSPSSKRSDCLAGRNRPSGL